MRKTSRVLGLVLLGVLGGCHTVSTAALDELKTARAVAKANVNDAAVSSSDKVKHVIWAQGRVYDDVLLDVLGDSDVFFQVDPWAPVVAPVGSGGK